MNPIKRPSSAQRRIKKKQSGVAAVELALALPLLLLFLGGLIETTNLLLIAEKVDRVSFTVADLVTQSQAITLDDLSTICTAADQLMTPYDFSTDGIVIISSIYKPPSTTNALVKWQYKSGNLARVSRIGLQGKTATFPSGLELNSGDNVITAEVYYAYKPLFGNLGIYAAKDLYHAAYYKPRLSALTATPK